MKETEGRGVSEEAEFSEEEKSSEEAEVSEEEEEEGVPSGTEEVSEDRVLAEGIFVAGGSQEPFVPAQVELGTDSGSRRKCSN